MAELSYSIYLTMQNSVAVIIVIVCKLSEDVYMYVVHSVSSNVINPLMGRKNFVGKVHKRQVERKGCSIPFLINTCLDVPDIYSKLRYRTIYSAA